MKIVSLLLTLFFVTTSAQNKISVNDSFFLKALFTPGIDTSKPELYHALIDRLAKLDNRDSVSEALFIMHELFRFLPHKYSVKSFSEQFKQIDKFRLIYSNQISGTWKSEGMGSNWSALDQPLINPNRRAVFTGDEVFFYLKDSLVRHTFYKIIPDNSMPWRFENYLIEFSDSKERWAFYFMQPGDHVPYHGRAEIIHLMLRQHPNCLCGCPDQLYSNDAKEVL